MAFLFCDSFDHYSAAQILYKYNIVANSTAGTFQISNGRRGGKGFNGQNTGTGGAGGAGPGLILVPGNGDNIVTTGMAFTTDSLNWSANGSTSPTGGQNMFAVYDVGLAVQMWFRMNVDGTISAYRQAAGPTGVLLATTTEAISTNNRVYIEFQAKIATGTAGFVKVRFDGITVMNTSSINTGGNGTSVYNAVLWGFWNRISNSGGTLTYNWDDVYLLDGVDSTATEGVPMNDFLGDQRIDVGIGTTDGNYSQWARSAGSSNLANIDENPGNDDTDYNETDGVNNIDTFNFSSPIANTTFNAIQLPTIGKKTDSGPSNYKGVFRAGGVDYLTAQEKAFSASYQAKRTWFVKNPNTGALFVSADFPVEMGYKKTA
jgi:hypothetical protein